MTEEKLVNGINDFSLEIYKQLKQEEKNLFFSPFSIYTTLLMVYLGARGETEEQIKSSLHIQLEEVKLHSEFKKLLNILQRNKASELNIANLLCIEENYKLLESYIWKLKDTYDNAVWKLDFSNVVDTCLKINKWVEEQTHGKIKNIIQSISNKMGIVLVNAIYFKGTWENLFKEKDTKDEKFNLVSGETTDIPLMYQKSKFRWLEEDDFQILELPYKGERIFGSIERMSMVIILPKKIDGINSLEENLNIDNLMGILSKLNKVWEREIKVHVPKFRVERGYELSNALRNLGMIDVFSDGANFSGIADDPPRFISKVIHKAFVDVNESGTEAAAATAVVMLGCAMMQLPEIPIFQADHPFIFLIMDTNTRAILFIGRLMNPKQT